MKLVKGLIISMAAIAAFSFTHKAQAQQAADKPAQNATVQAEKAKPAGPVLVEMKTSEGAIKLELWPDKAPGTVKNFLQYAEEGFYDGTIFHRVIDGFMIQGGGMTKDMSMKPAHGPIKNEAGNGEKNLKGTIAMARTSAPDSATCQFFINLNDNVPLDHRDDTPQGIGYAVFGKVVAGMDVVEKIGKTKTTIVAPYQDVPAQAIVIESVKMIKGK